MRGGYVRSPVAVFLDAVVAEVDDDDVIVGGDGDAARAFQLALVAVDRRDDLSSSHIQHLQVVAALLGPAREDAVVGVENDAAEAALGPAGREQLVGEVALGREGLYARVSDEDLAAVADRDRGDEVERGLLRADLEAAESFSGNLRVGSGVEM